MDDHAACPKGSSVSVALITVSPGNQLPHVVVDSDVKCLTASVYAGAYFLVVVGEGIDVAYLEIVSGRHQLVAMQYPPNSLIESKREWLEVVARRSSSMGALRSSRMTLRRMKDLLALNDRYKTRDSQK